MKHIGILGGTFDPPHIGHLIIAEEARAALSLEEVWFIPSCEPPHKHNAFISPDNRIKMLQLAIDGNPSFKINSIEIDRLGKSYTFDTMKMLRNEYPNVAFYFIIGADMVEYLPHWQQIDELMELVTFVGVKRPGYNLNTDFSIIEVEVPTIAISSTLIRKRLMNQQTVTYLIPESVKAYIKEKGLYE